jgi:hypothetical protein
MSYFGYYRPNPLAILVFIEIGFTLNKLYILGVVLREQFLKNLRRSTKVGDRDLFSATEISCFILTPEYKPIALILY